MSDAEKLKEAWVVWLGFMAQISDLTERMVQVGEESARAVRSRNFAHSAAEYDAAQARVVATVKLHEAIAREQDRLWTDWSWARKRVVAAEQVVKESVEMKNAELIAERH